MITVAEGPDGRDAKWSHPDLLPTLPGDKPADGVATESSDSSQSSVNAGSSTSHPAADGKTDNIDVIPANIDLSAAEVQLVTKGADPQKALDEAAERLANETGRKIA